MPLIANAYLSNVDNTIRCALYRAPEYGSPQWQALDDSDPLKLRAVVQAAECWRVLSSSPHVAELIAEWSEWDERRRMRETSWVISAAADWVEVASAPSYAELRRRRALTSDIPCGAPDCSAVVTLTHPLPDELAARLPDTSSVRCPDCARRGRGAAA